MTTNLNGAVVTIKEESGDYPTNGHFKSYGVSFVAAGNATTIYNFSIPYPIALLAGIFLTNGKTSGDTMDFDVAPDTVVGVLTEDASIGDTIINVQPSVVANVDYGFYVKLDDGVNSEEHLVVSKTATTLTLHTALINNYSAVTPTYVKMTVKMVENMSIEENGRYILGDSKIGGTHIPANTTMRIRYTNIGSGDVTIKPVLEFLY